MKIKIYLPGKNIGRNYEDAVNHYIKLFSGYGRLEIIELGIKEESPVDLSEITSSIQKGYKIALTEKGSILNTIELKQKLITINQEHGLINFVFGNAWGFKEESLKEADYLLSLSKLTLAHDLALVVLLEQLFRIANLNAGGKYHK